MAFAGISVIVAGKLVEGSTTTTFNAVATSGYHLLVVEGHSRTRAQRRDEPIVSRYFTVGGHPWRIFYYPDGSHRDNAGFISLHLSSQMDCDDTGVMARFEFSFVDETDKQEPALIRASRKPVLFDWYPSMGYDRFMKMDDLNKSKHLKGDSFTIRCDIVVAEEDVTTPFIEVPPSDMKQNFTDLLVAGEGTDVVFQVGGETLSAHRCVLAARSAVFKASLFGSMKEGSTTTLVQIDDMEATVFKALLQFIYSDSLSAPAKAKVEEELEGNDKEGVALLQHLLIAADRYDLRRLSAMCEKRLCEHIGVGTATSILALAEQHRCNGLKEACYEFLRCPANLKAVVATDGFDHLCRSCPPVMKDLVIGMLQAPK